MKRSLLGRVGAVSATAAAIVLAVAGPASAHVTVNPNTAAQGAYAKVSFRVPTESDTASTTKLEVDLPADTPIASVAVKPLPGWTAVTEKSKLHSDGSIVRWIDLPNADGSEPDHPAPTLKLTAATTTDPAAASAVPTVAVAAASTTADSGSGGALGWGIAALVVAVLALVLGLLAYRKAGASQTSA